MFDIKTQTAVVGDQSITFETGLIARQAAGAVRVQFGDVELLVAATISAKPLQNVDFLPMAVHYQEKTYAAGRFLGGFLKREGRPSEKEILTSRLIDRPIRPLFPKGYFYDTQIIATVISADAENNPDIMAINGASAALSISGIPFQGPIAAARVAYINDEFVLNPTYAQVAESKLDLIVAGTREAVLMVESEAQELSEETMLDAIMFGHAGMQPIINAIEALAKDVNKAARKITLAGNNADVAQQVSEVLSTRIADAYALTDKQARSSAIDAIRSDAQEQFASEDRSLSNDVSQAVKALEKKVVRQNILQGKPRIDGRNTSDVRQIDCRTNILPRTHGSALFTRGETQALVTVTLGTDSDMQMTEDLESVRKKRFMLHYNFPPYSVGETGRFGAPGRREIGHGRLAQRGLECMLPDMESFGYAIRVVSEITESNGSSSMASVCGASLAMMQAGVPMKRPVSGIAMGLILEGEDHAVLSDIMGDEDHLGDMDFKVAGTCEGITTLQLDIKIAGLTRDIMQQALVQANEGRMHILAEMAKSQEVPNESIAEHAPRLFSMKIKPTKIRELIGPGGKTIRGIVDATGAKIDIDDDGIVKIFAANSDSGDAARKMVEELTSDVEIGTIYDGKIVKIVDFGAFVRIAPNTDGLLHISQIAQKRIAKVDDELSEGQEVRVKVLDVDARGKIRLSMKALLDD
ncbi:MAG: polyribonucleotide nucleotidyltransferase [Mariprofundaceae bacterium]|nr:polyribonucleotide nucleotidyltransferase [Mariprofundaceae bacterium]